MKTLSKESRQLKKKTNDSKQLLGINDSFFFLKEIKINESISIFEYLNLWTRKKFMKVVNNETKI